MRLITSHNKRREWQHMHFLRYLAYILEVDDALATEHEKNLFEFLQSKRHKWEGFEFRKINYGAPLGTEGKGHFDITIRINVPI